MDINLSVKLRIGFILNIYSLFDLNIFYNCSCIALYVLKTYLQHVVLLSLFWQLIDVFSECTKFIYLSK